MPAWGTRATALAQRLREAAQKVNGDLPETSTRAKVGAHRQDDGVPTESVSTGHVRTPFCFAFRFASTETTS
jgi:hypothetical protein